MKAIAYALIALGCCAPLAAAQPQRATVSIFSGETVMVRTLSSFSQTCEVTWRGMHSLEIMEGPSEITAKYELGPIDGIHTSGKVCKHIAGATFYLTAAPGVTEKKEGDLTLRANYKTSGDRVFPFTMEYHVVIYPAREPAQPAKTQ